MSPLTSAQRILMAAALADEHDLSIGTAIAYADTAADALHRGGANADEIIAAADAVIASVDELVHPGHLAASLLVHLAADEG